MVIATTAGAHLDRGVSTRPTGAVVRAVVARGVDVGGVWVGPDADPEHPVRSHTATHAAATDVMRIMTV